MLTTFPILSAQEASALENLIFDGDTYKIRLAMLAAGKNIAAGILDDFQEIQPLPAQFNILVLLGKGHNGGDALIAAHELVADRPGSRITIVAAFEEKAWKPLVKEAYERLVAIQSEEQELSLLHWQGPASAESLIGEAFDIVIDGLLGQGARNPLPTTLSELLAWVNALQPAPLLRAAVDLPSGLDERKTKTAFKADFTYITGIPKTRLFHGPNNPWTGRIRMIDLGLLSDRRLDKKNHRLVNANVFKQLRGLRSHMAYKSSIGHLLLIGGSAGMPGAILMAAKAAVQSGIGLTTVALPADIQPFVAPQLPEAIWEGIPCALEGSFDIDLMRRVHLNVDTFQAIVAGPGMVRDKQNLFIICRIIREVPLPLILDASALSSDCLNAFISRPKSFPKVIITPHMGEYLRVRGGKAEVYDPEDFLEFCHKFNIITLLKGSITRISDGQQLIEAPVAGPVLARGGAGDILAGMIGSLVAMDPENPLNALLKAVTWHGAAADVMAREFGQTAVRSTQLLDFLHSSLRN